MRVTLIATPIWATKTPPLTISYLAGWLRKHGHAVRSIDWNIELYHAVSDGLREYWDRTHLHKWQDAERYDSEIRQRIIEPSLSRLLDRALADRPQLVGISAYSIEATRQLARAIKRRAPDTVVVVGGQVCDPGFYGYALAWSEGVDAVVYGEGEGPLLELLEAVGRGERDWTSIKGLLLPHASGAVEDTGLRAPVASIDSLAWPDFHDLPMDLYTVDTRAPFAPSRSVSTLMARGCVRKCDFCLQAEIWQNFRFRDADDLYAEMAFHVREYGLTSYHFNDLVINGSVRQLDRLCDRLLAEPLGVTWGGNAIVSKSLKRSLLEKMKAAGCEFLGFGFESFSTPVLHAMGKKYDAAEVARLLGDLSAVGMRFFSNLIIGHPAEGRPEFAETVRFLIEHAHLFSEAPTSSLLIVQKNTPIWRARERWGIEMEDGDALGWRLAAGGNDLAERKRRAQIMNFFYETLFDTSIKITDIDTQRELMMTDGDVIPRTAQAN